MEILCNSFTTTANSLGDRKLTVVCEDARYDLVLQEIIDHKGAECILHVIGEEAIQKYMQSNGYTVFESSWQSA